ncbi:DEAD/DEAH box helicase [Actinomycetaceae bacterium MB13-C1-2]|nr:DEAD/DEAH box helicase [Actinomycetaceae bacterium MB13-C1-2]
MSKTEPTAAERMSLFRRHMAVEESGLGEYWQTLPFRADDFQVEALEAVALRESVLVCAPTGSGKTVVGEGAAFLALLAEERVFYTTPIKALSNQKFRDFSERFGDENVGLLTGDTTVNGDAPIVVMTTEVLRNMIYAGKNLENLGTVVLDEVHYLSDRFRGPVWEEVLIQLPRHTRVVALSATVSNYEQFGDWIASVRGSCTVVTSDKRPVPLYQHMMVGPRLYSLYAQPRRAAKANEATYRLNPDLIAAIGPSIPRSGRRAHPTPWVSRPKMVEVLQQKNLLPAIDFIFSRAGCDQAAEEVARAPLTLTTFEEREQIRKETSAALESIPAQDHAALGLNAWAETLACGVAAHHAGLLPILKETVERLFSRGLLKVVFATETLALGINMPARTVVLESLEKWDGSEHVRLGPREYTQLTGRAGRRGIDVEGNAVVMDRRDVSAEEVAALASKRSYPLKSAFFPSYNMAVNLLARSDMATTRQVLESSFAQYQADAAVVKLAQKLRETDERIGEVKAELHCDRGDAGEYFSLRDEVSRLQKSAAAASRTHKRQNELRSLSKLRIGDVVQYRRGRKWRRAVVIQPAAPGYAVPLPSILDENAKIGRLGPREASEGMEKLGRMHVQSGGLRRAKDRQFLARELREFQTKPRGKSDLRGRTADDSPEAERLLRRASELEETLRAHPVHSCPDREQHAGIGHRYVRLLRDRDDLAERIASRTARIVSEFDQVCTVLRSLGFLDKDTVTGRGEMLRRIYGERDLVVAQAISEGIWDELTPQEFAAIISTVVYEPRAEASASSERPSLPTERLRDAWANTEAIGRVIRQAEQQAGIDRTTELSADLVAMTYQWARGASLAKVLEGSEMSGGDFVRWMRQILDMLQQIRRVEGSPLHESATAAYDAVLRGVVAWTEDL